MKPTDPFASTYDLSNPDLIVDPGPTVANGSLATGPGQTSDITALVESLVTLGFDGEIETITDARSTSGVLALGHGTLTYTAPAGGPDTLLFTITDQLGNAASGTIDVGVQDAVQWSGGSGDWNTSSNWWTPGGTGHVPGPATSVLIDSTQACAMVGIAPGAAAAADTIAVQGALLDNAGLLQITTVATLANTATLQNDGQITFAPGAIGIVGDGVVLAPALINSGTISFAGDASVSGLDRLWNQASMAFVGAGTIAANNIENDGTISIAQTGIISAPATLVNQGEIDVRGVGTSVIAGPLVNNGVVVVQAGHLEVRGFVTGTGTIDVAAGAAVTFDAGIDVSQTIAFGGPGATLAIAPGAAVNGPVTGFMNGDTLDFLIASVIPSYTNGVLSVSAADGAGTSVILPGDFSSSVFVPTTDGHQGTDIGATFDRGPVAAIGRLSVPHAATIEVTGLIAGLVTPGVAGDTETVTDVASANGSVTLNPDRTITYAAPLTGADTISFDVADQFGHTAAGSVTVTVIDPPVITGGLAPQFGGDRSSLLPFADFALVDPNVGQTETVTVTASNAGNFLFSNLGSGNYDPSSGVYIVSGSAESVTAALDGLRFTPHPGLSTSTDFTIAASDGLDVGGPRETSVAITAASAGNNSYSLPLSPGDSYSTPVDLSKLGFTALELTTGAGSLTGLGIALTGFSEITLDAGANWTLTGSNTLPNGTTIDGTGVLTNTGTLMAAQHDGLALLTIPSFVNNGAIRVSNLDPLIIQGTLLTTLGQSGISTVDTGGVLELDGLVDSAQTILFADGAGQVTLGDPTEFAGTLAGLQSGDRIDLSGIAPGSIASVVTDLSHQQLVVSETGGAKIDLAVGAEVHLSQLGFRTASDGNGGTNLTAFTLAASTTVYLDGYNNTVTSVDAGGNGFDGADIVGGRYGNDTLQGTAASETITAYGWNNTIMGNGGSDTIHAGQGQAHVSVSSQDGDNTIIGGLGGDTITLGNGRNTITLAGYNNIVTVGAGIGNVLDVGAGNSTVALAGGSTSVTARGYNDIFQIGGGTTALYGMQGGARIALGASFGAGDSVTLAGAAADRFSFSNGMLDVMKPDGSPYASINAGHGASLAFTADGQGGEIVTLGSNPTPPPPVPPADLTSITETTGGITLALGSGDSTVHLTGWNNVFSAGAGTHVVDGAQGGTSITLGAGNNTVTADGFSDVISLGAGNNTITGTQGNATITTGDGNQTITAGGYGNIIRTGSGTSTIIAGAGGATVDTGAGGDAVTLAGWNNLVIGGLGHDLIIGGAGNVYQANGAGPGGGFTVQDFGVSQGNVLDISQVLHDAMQYHPGCGLAGFLQVTAQGHDTVVSLDLTGSGSHFAIAATLDGANAGSLMDLQSRGAIRMA